MSCVEGMRHLSNFSPAPEPPTLGELMRERYPFGYPPPKRWSFLTTRDHLRDLAAGGSSGRLPKLDPGDIELVPVSESLDSLNLHVTQVEGLPGDALFVLDGRGRLVARMGLDGTMTRITPEMAEDALRQALERLAGIAPETHENRPTTNVWAEQESYYC